MGEGPYFLGEVGGMLTGEVGGMMGAGRCQGEEKGLDQFLQEVGQGPDARVCLNITGWRTT